MKARITLAKEMIGHKLLTLFPEIERIIDSKMSWEPQDAPLICISSDFPVKYEPEPGNNETAHHLVSFDIYLKRGDSFRDSSDTDKLMEKIKQELKKDPYLGGLVSKCHLSESMCQQMNGEHVVRLLQGTIEIEFTVSIDEEDDGIPDDWNLNARSEIGSN